MRSCAPGMLARVVEPARHRLVERIDQQGGLAAARHAGDGREQPQRDLGRDVLEVVLARADHLQRLAVALPPLLRHRDLAHAGEVLPGDALRARHDVVGRALGHDVAAVDAGAGADVHHVVGGEDGVLVVLHHDHGVADVAQVLERFQQAGVVALVQADGGLVQHVEHAGEPRADLRGEPDALALAARQRARRARQGEIVEPHVDQELQPLADLLQDAGGDLVLLGLLSLFGSSANQSLAARMEKSVTWPMCSASIFTASACGLRR